MYTIVRKIRVRTWIVIGLLFVGLVFILNFDVQRHNHQSASQHSGASTSQSTNVDDVLVGPPTYSPIHLLPSGPQLAGSGTYTT